MPACLQVQAARSAPLQAPAEAGSSGDEDGNVTSGATDPHVSSENDSEEEILSGTLNPPGPSSQQPDSSQELLRGGHTSYTHLRPVHLGHHCTVVTVF